MKGDQTTPRIEREIETVSIMISHYCKAKHKHQDSLCPKCQTLLNYVKKRLRDCPFQEIKTTCGKCSIHCYAPAKRDDICKVMSYAGPRMILTNPFMAIQHAIDGLRKTPAEREKQRKK